MQACWKIALAVLFLAFITDAAKKKSMTLEQQRAHYFGRLIQCQGEKKCPSAKQINATTTKMLKSKDGQACVACMAQHCGLPSQKGCLAQLRLPDCHCARDVTRTIRKCRVCMGGLEPPSLE